MSSPLVPEFMKPESKATVPYAPKGNELAWCATQDGTAVFSAFLRPEGNVGVKLVAWVAYRDDDGTVLHHAWHEVLPSTPVLVSSVHEARIYVEQLSANRGLSLTAWTQVSSYSEPPAVA